MAASKKSFDLVPRKRKRRREETKSDRKRSPHPRLSQRAPKRPLRDRRREAVARIITLWCLLVLFIVGAFLYFLSRPEVRINTVSVEGSIHASLIETLVLAELSGTYYGMVPRNSFFFYPERAVRDAVLSEYPDVAALSVSRGGFTTLSLRVVPRAFAFLWCGPPESLGTDNGLCYETDAEGFVFKESTGTTSEALRVYALLTEEGAEHSYPIRARVEGVPSLPAVLQFVQEVNELGVAIAAIAIRGDEADLFIKPGTRLTYIIGKEREAQKNIEAAFPNLSLSDGSIEYLDLRFDNKVYVKRHGEE